MKQKLDKHKLSNGMILLGERMEAVESVAFGFMLPAGAAVLPAGCCGAANVISDWIFRGAGERDNRQLGDALDGLGLQRSAGVDSAHISVGAALEASNLSAAIDLYGDIILRAKLEDEQFIPARQLAIEGVKGLDDDPRQKVMLKLREQFYPEPLGRSTAGEIADLEALTPQTTKKIIAERFNPAGTIFSVAGKYDFDAVVRQAEKIFGAKSGSRFRSPKTGEAGGRYKHIPNDGAQVHIGLMTPTVVLKDKNYYNARVAVGVLSGGMGARLFTEVREKRGLCYAVGAQYHAMKEAAGVMCYAGTTPDKAQETYDVIVAEFNRLAEGISEEELQRAKVGLKSAMIMQSESSSSRAGSVAGDYYMLGKVRTLDGIKKAIDGTTVDSVLTFLRENRFKDFTVVTIGPKEVKVG
ncbi:MAG: pitrilysin family protein [Sedimentisphaerales bacterium]|jgi:predicted Zn-dependent peptidase